MELYAIILGLVMLVILVRVTYESTWQRARREQKVREEGIRSGMRRAALIVNNSGLYGCGKLADMVRREIPQ